MKDGSQGTRTRRVDVHIHTAHGVEVTVPEQICLQGAVNHSVKARQNPPAVMSFQELLNVVVVEIFVLVLWIQCNPSLPQTVYVVVWELGFPSLYDGFRDHIRGFKEKKQEYRTG